MSVPNRQRQKATVRVKDGRQGDVIITAYDGILPEEMLVLLMEQRLTFHAREYDDEGVEEKWHGPTEQIQQALVRGTVSSSEEDF